jgi:hypothetical protein
MGRDPDMNHAMLVLLIDPISEAVDRWCRRSFTPVTAAVAFDYQDAKTLRLHRDLISLTSITTNAGQTFQAGAVLLEPRSGPPYRWLSLFNSSDQFLYSATPINAISVNGVWGYKATVPGAVKLATIKWVLAEYNKADVQGYGTISAAGMNVGMSFADKADPPLEVQELLNSYRRRRVEAVL